jgi:hypothetical protein
VKISPLHQDYARGLHSLGFLFRDNPDLAQFFPLDAPSFRFHISDKEDPQKVFQSFADAAHDKGAIISQPRIAAHGNFVLMSVRWGGFGITLQATYDPEVGFEMTMPDEIAA